MKIEQLASFTIADLIEAYRNGTTDPSKVLEVTHFQVERANPRINAIYGARWDDAAREAEASTRRWRHGQPRGALDGIPVTIKDSVHALGMRWHHGSAAHGAGVVGRHDAPPAARLKAANAIVIGKCTMPDYGMSGSGVSSFHGITRNPWNTNFSTGGSSAGAGASLAAGIGMMSVGSDIAGSVRLPAAHCGVAALKPTQGVIAHTPPSDVRSAGPIARHAADLELLLRVLGGVHPDDRFSLPVLEPHADNDAVRVAVHADFGFGPRVEADVLAVLGRAAQALLESGVRVDESTAHYDFDAYLPIDESFKLRAWREYASAAPELRDATPEKLIAWFREAAEWSAARVGQFEAGIARGVGQTNRLFDTADFLLTPAMPIVNFPADRIGFDESMPLRHCTFTAPFNQSGHPAVVIRGGFDRRGLPVGVQLVGRRFDDVRLVRLATALEAALLAYAGRCWPTCVRAEADQTE